MYENNSNKATRLFQAGLWFICLLLITICIFPLLNVMATSLSSPSAILRGEVYLLPIEMTFDAYRRVLVGTRFLSSLSYTTVLTLAFTVIAMVMTILCAYPLSKSFLKGRRVILVFIIFTMYFEAGIIPNYLVIRDFHLLNNTWSLILPGMLSAFNMIIMRNFFQSIDQSILESASMDGASEIMSLLRIVIPLSKPVIATLALFYAVSRWNAISDAIFYLTDSDKYPLQLVLKEIILAEKASNLDAGQSAVITKTLSDSVKSASVVLSTIPILIVYPFAQKYFTKGIMLGSIKG